MEKLLCESTVYCDCLLIILLIVGVLIDNKAFVSLFVYTHFKIQLSVQSNLNQYLSILQYLVSLTLLFTL